MHYNLNQDERVLDAISASQQFSGSSIVLAQTKDLHHHALVGAVTSWAIDYTAGFVLTKKFSF